MAAKDPACNDPADTCCPAWDEGSLVQRCAEFPAIIAAPDDVNLTSTAVVNTAGTKVTLVFTVPVDMLWCSSSARRTGNFRETMKLRWENESVDNGPVRDYLFWGQPGQPSRHAPKFLPRNKTIEWELEDLSGAGVNALNLVKLALHGFQIPAKYLQQYADAFGKGRGLMRFTNQGAGDVIPALSPYPSIIRMEDGQHFRHDTTCADSTSAEYEGKYTYRDARMVRSIDNANKRLHSSLWTGCVKGTTPAAAGIPGRPYVLPSPEVIQEGSSVEFDLVDKSNAANTWWVLFTGARVPACAAVGRAVGEGCE